MRMTGSTEYEERETTGRGSSSGRESAANRETTTRGSSSERRRGGVDSADDERSHVRRGSAPFGPDEGFVDEGEQGRTRMPHRGARGED